MDEIKDGEYFRCKKFGRIGKYLDSFYDGTEFNVNCEPNCTFVYHSKEDFISSIEHSKDIMDLIEVGDIVNGCEVVSKKYTYMKMNFINVDSEISYGWGDGVIPENKIKSILTHEMYERNCYKVVE